MVLRTRVAGAGVAAALVCGLALTVSSQPKVACDPDNGGITLPQGFCAARRRRRPRRGAPPGGGAPTATSTSR